MGSQVKAVIFANDPQTQLPREGAPIAQSSETLNVTSMSGEWYNFTMNFAASQNTVYWIGYSSENFTRYYFDVGGASISVTSQPGRSSLFPTVWSYQGKSIMSLRALYTSIAPKPNPTTSPQSSPSGQAQGLQNILPVLLIICVESGIMVTYRLRKSRNAVNNKPSLNLTGTYGNPVAKLLARFPLSTELVLESADRIRKAIENVF